MLQRWDKDFTRCLANERVISQIVRKVAVGANTIPIAVADYVRGNGWKRQIDSIDQIFLQKTVEKVGAAVTGSNLG